MNSNKFVRAYSQATQCIKDLAKLERWLFWAHFWSNNFFCSGCIISKRLLEPKIKPPFQVKFVLIGDTLVYLIIIIKMDTKENYE